MRLHQAIKKLRNLKGFEQKELASMTGISKGHFCLIEQGKVKPKPEYIDRICKALGIPKFVLMHLSGRNITKQESKHVKPVVQEFLTKIFFEE